MEKDLSSEPEKAMAPHSSTLAWKIHGQRSLVGCSPWGRKESDMTERLHFHFSLSFTGERNGDPLQYSCLENPRDGGAWWAAVYGVAQSRTRLKRLSSSSSSREQWNFIPNHHRSLFLINLLFPPYGSSLKALGYQVRNSRTFLRWPWIFPSFLKLLTMQEVTCEVWHKY